jgi:hypothetical protein
MTTPTLRFYFGLAIVGYLGAIIYGIGTGGDPIGVATFGWSGGVGDHVGYAILVGVAASSFGLGVIEALLILPSPEELAAPDREALPPAEAPLTTAPWPILGAFGVGVALLGLVTENVVFIAGCVVVVVTLIEWAVQTWSDKATGDAEVNRSIRSRLMQPFEIPVLGLMIVAFVVLGISRVLLALPKDGSVGFAMLAAVIILGAAILVSRPKDTRNLVTGLLVAGGILVLAGGVAAAIVGERDIEEHHAEEHGSEGHAEEEEVTPPGEVPDDPEDGYVVIDPGNGVPPTDDEVERTEPAEGNTPASAPTTTVPVEGGE